MSSVNNLKSILFLSHYYSPRIGGVEKHVLKAAKYLNKFGYKVTILTEKFDKKSKDQEIDNRIKIIRIIYVKIKLLGLFTIWVSLWRNRKIIKDSDIIHIHDVFIWYLPFRLLYPKKPVITTIHGLEWENPLNIVSILQKRLAVSLSNRSVGVGKFMGKYLHVTFNNITYGAAETQKSKFKKNNNALVYVGRLEENTGILKSLDWLKKNPKYKVDFCGDGDLKRECEKYGTVHGFTDPGPFYKKAKFCIPGGYLAALEALSFGCELKLFWNDKIKEDYWKMSPFVKKDVKSWAKQQTWSKLANEYISLYNSIK